VALQVVTVFVVAVVRARSGSGSVDELMQSAGTDGTFVSLCTFVTTLFCCGLIALVVALKKGAVLKEYLALQPVPRNTFLAWLVAILFFGAASDALTAWLGRPIVPPFVQIAYATADPVWMLWIAVVVGAPIFEETFFRGFLYKGFAATPLRPAGAVVLLSALWASIHLQYGLYEIGIIFAMGLLIGAARIQTGSITVPIAMHSLASLVATIEAAMLR